MTARRLLTFIIPVSALLTVGSCFLYAYVKRARSEIVDPSTNQRPSRNNTPVANSDVQSIDFTLKPKQLIERLQNLQLTSADLNQLLSDINNHYEGDARDYLRRYIVMRIAESDTQGAWAALQTIPAGVFKNSLVADFVNVSSTKLLDVLPLMDSLDYADERTAFIKAVERLLPSMSLRDLQQLAARKDMQHLDFTNAFTSAILSESSSDTSAVNALMSLSPTLKRAVAGSVISNVAGRNANTALDLLRGLEPNPVWDVVAIDGIIASGLSKNPDTALGYARSFAAGERRNLAFESLGMLWGQRDAEAASKALNGFGQGIDKDYAVLGLVKFLVSKGSIEDAKKWYDRIATTSARGRVSVNEFSSTPQ